MKNLNIQELSSEELRTIEGGIANPILAGLALAGSAFYFGWELGREYARKH
ncbi:class IIb bacteriocin, lactobin A/cerein 7B family [Elizabethkingia anophelis]|nr:class IIb bacteriocin, lactobin A/cerein 7B family [Elizabethkingia anophelis]MCT4017821.1 class IIb bacteriocin, lactobin A/cerein 7B family [Elizabethkingia anophelis]MCT4021383.1 class IIb bacteriocin, lactobin A/cerein 7B family [Elizabethkingia anophelis]